MNELYNKYMYKNFMISHVPPELGKIHYLINCARFNKDNASINTLLALSKHFDYNTSNLTSLIGIEIDNNVDESVEMDSELIDEFEQLLIYNSFNESGFYEVKKEVKINIEKAADYFLTNCYIVEFPDSTLKIYNKVEGIYEDFNEELFGKLFYSFVRSFNQPFQLWNNLREVNIFNAIKRSSKSIKEEDLQSSIKYIPVNNGIVNLNDMTLLNFSPNYFFTSKSPIDYAPEKECPKFIKAMTLTCSNDQEKLQLLQQLFGYGFVRNNLCAKMVFFLGDGASGKSTVVDMIGALYQKKSYLSLDEVCVPFELVNLVNKEINIGHENGNTNINNINSNVLKMLVTGNEINVQVKHKNSFSSKITCKLYFLFNNLLDLDAGSDHSFGFWRRVILMEFNESFKRNGKEKKNLANELLEQEASGILKWALEGTKSLIESDYEFCKCTSSEKALEKYKSEVNPLEEFLNNNLIYKEGSRLTRKELQNSFKEYCVKECISTRGFDSSRVMWKNFEIWYKRTFNKMPVTFKSSQYRGYKNVAFKEKKIGLTRKG